MNVIIVTTKVFLSALYGFGTSNILWGGNIMKDAVKLNLKDTLEAEQIEWEDQQLIIDQRLIIGREMSEDEERKWIEQQSEWEAELAEQQRPAAKDNSHY